MLFGAATGTRRSVTTAARVLLITSRQLELERQKASCVGDLINDATPVVFLVGNSGPGGAQCENTMRSSPNVTDTKREGTIMHL